MAEKKSSNWLQSGITDEYKLGTGPADYATQKEVDTSMRFSIYGITIHLHIL